VTKYRKLPLFVSLPPIDRLLMIIFIKGQIDTVFKISRYSTNPNTDTSTVCNCLPKGNVDNLRNALDCNVSMGHLAQMGLYQIALCKKMQQYLYRNFIAL